MDKYELLEQVLEYLSADQLLNELVSALSSDEAKDNFEYIIRMHDLDIDLD